MTAALRLRVLPRFPARITGTDGVKVTRAPNSPDLTVSLDFENLGDISGIPNPEENFFAMWDRATGDYKRIAFQSMFDSAGIAAGYATKVVAQASNIPAAVHAIELYGDATVGDGDGGLYIDTNNGSADTFISGDGRTWYRAADVGPKRIDAPQQVHNVLGVFETKAAASAASVDNAISVLELTGNAAATDRGGFHAVQVTEDASPLGPGQFKTNVNLKRWENADNVITPAMFADFGEMLTFTKAQMRIPAGNYEFDGFITVRDNAVIRCEKGTTFIPTFEPVGVDRANPLIDFGNGADVNYLKLHLAAGINTIRKGFRFGDGCQIGYVECTSADLNNNRTEPGSTDLISGAVLIDGDHIRIGHIVLSRFDRGWTVIDSNDVIIGKIRNLETLMGGYVHGTRDLHVLAAYATGASLADAATLNRGPMTPGLNSVVLAGCSDSSFSNWQSFDMLEHAIRVGGIAAGTTVPNEGVSFINVRSYRPYGCGFKMDDGDAFLIKRISVQGLYTEDVGHDNWFGSPGYQNWSVGGVNDPATNNDGNKAAFAIRNSQYVTFSDFSNKVKAYANSGYIGLWIERSNYTQGSNIDTEKSREDGVVIQSGGATSPERIELRGVATRENGASGLLLDASASNATWRGVQVLGLDSQNNTGYGYEVTGRLDGASPYATLKSRIEGSVYGNTAGSRLINANVAADPDFIDDVSEDGTFTPGFSFATPGDLALGSVVASGTWKREGRWITFEGSYSATVTHTTAAGNLRITGFPFAAADGDNIVTLGSIPNLSSWNARTMLVGQIANANTFMELRGYAAAVAGSPMSTLNVATGSTFAISFAGRYRI